MAETTAVPLSGRRAQAARNDQRILDAAREVFLADPEAPISAVAERAGVGISALYRRYASKEELLRRLSGEGLQRYIAEIETALAHEGDPWGAFVDFMQRVVDAGSGELTLRLAGTFTPTEDLYRDANRAQELNVRLFERTKATGGMRPDIDVNDVSLVFELVAAVHVGNDERTRRLRRRYLTLILDAFHRPGTKLPGPPPTWKEISGRWDTSPAG
ncbi:MAG: TetR/AcrR family transcriptional regulator [Actinomycetota bacterium]